MVWVMFELDASLSFVILLAGVTVFFSSVSVVMSDAAADYWGFSMRSRALQASEALVATSGHAGSVGLAAYEQDGVRHHELNLSELARLAGTGGAELGNKLGMGLGANAAVEVSGLGGNLLFGSGGSKPEGSLVVSRIALCGGEACVVRLYVWK
ncbi:hypothetical protein HYS54_04280 [Candidatus Micrarchaeota archaeon]|nr:hypothetical protein [Candidatus Micrarchaeota archaeon]